MSRVNDQQKFYCLSGLESGRLVAHDEATAHTDVSFLILRACIALCQSVSAKPKSSTLLAHRPSPHPSEFTFLWNYRKQGKLFKFYFVSACADFMPPLHKSVLSWVTSVKESVHTPPHLVEKMTCVSDFKILTKGQDRLLGPEIFSCSELIFMSGIN